MALMGLSKNYREAAQGMQVRVKGATTTEETDSATGYTSVTVEGTFEVFDRMAMDMWGGKMRFVFRGKDEPEERDDDFYTMIGHIAAAQPGLAAVLTSSATLQVFKESIVRSETQTWIDGKLQREPIKVERIEWRDVTEEFSKHLNPSHDAGW